METLEDEEVIDRKEVVDGQDALDDEEVVDGQDTLYDEATHGQDTLYDEEVVDGQDTLDDEEPIPTNAIETAAYLIRHCEKCDLHRTRINAVPGDGPMDPVVMFIAEGPGKSEDEQGRPFMGAAGKFLDELLPLAGLAREDVFITNMIKCRAPDNRDPTPEEMDKCRNHLDRQIIILDPKLIITLGKFSTGKFLPGETIGQARGRLRQKNGRFIYPIMHPAAGLRRGDFKQGVIEDFRAIPDILRQIDENPPEEEPLAKPREKKSKEDPNIIQNTLF